MFIVGFKSIHLILSGIYFHFILVHVIGLVYYIVLNGIKSKIYKSPKKLFLRQCQKSKVLLDIVILKKHFVVFDMYRDFRRLNCKYLFLSLNRKAFLSKMYKRSFFFL